MTFNIYGVEIAHTVCRHLLQGEKKEKEIMIINNL